jgi:hypothetical protein
MVNLSPKTSEPGKSLMVGQWELLTDTQWGAMACFLRYKGAGKGESLRRELLEKMGTNYVLDYGGNPYLNSWDWFDLHRLFDFCLAVKGVKVKEVFYLLNEVWSKIRIFPNSLSEIVPLLMLYDYRLRSWGKYRYSVKEFAILATEIFGIPVSAPDVIECFKRNKIPCRKKGRDYEFPARKNLFRSYQAYLSCEQSESPKNF